ncbi:MAG: hypothetical protein JXB88_18975 [Spirochaetales bacterium]|nr:hypothetical protein [Spirochaetales bacterium]
MFFKKALDFASPEQLFYLSEDGNYYAYWPSTYKGKKSTLQSRNALIGDFTEKWTCDIINTIMKPKGLFAVKGVICEEIALSKQSPADVVISTSNKIIQKVTEIKAIFEVKMSIVWNWEYKKNEADIICIGNYKEHKGTPGLLRSDSMLKAIGKSINIRVSSNLSTPIPIIILGNTPITDSYVQKVDHLKTAGVIQGFWSLNPAPLHDDSDIKYTPKHGFIKFIDIDTLKESIYLLLSQKLHFFSGMKNAIDLGKIIEVANRENAYEKKAEKFLRLLGED